MSTTVRKTFTSCKEEGVRTGSLRSLGASATPTALEGERPTTLDQEVSDMDSVALGLDKEQARPPDVGS